MRGLECKCRIFPKKIFLSCFFLVAFLASLVLSFGFSLNASAFGITGTDQYAIQEAHSGFGTAIDNSQGTWTRIYTLQKVNDDYWVNLPASGLSAVTVMSLKLNKNIPANSLVSLSVTWTTESVGSTGFIYHSLQFEHNRSSLWDSCINFAGQPMYSSDKFMTFTCNYVFYNASDTNIIDSIYGSHIWEVIHQADVDDHVNVVIRQPTSIQLSNNGLTYSDRLWLQQNMPGASEAQIEQAIVDGQAAAREQERQEFDTEAGNALDSLDDNTDQQAISTKFTSILTIIDNFVSAVTHPIVSTCILPIDLRNYTGASFYEVDLCHLSPPSGITTVLNVIFIFFVLGLAYSAIRSVIQMYKEVIDG